MQLGQIYFFVLKKKTYILNKVNYTQKIVESPSNWICLVNIKTFLVLILQYYDSVNIIILYRYIRLRLRPLKQKTL